MITNLYKVPKKAWSKWTDQAKEIFNKTYEYLFANQSVIRHPDGPILLGDHWKTISWNAAWIAAEACDDTIPTEVITK